MNVDCLIVGAGPAGSSAALLLARSCRTVLLCDDGHPRNECARAIRGLLTHEGQSPRDFRASVREALAAYRDVICIQDCVAEVRAVVPGFSFRTQSGTTGTARRVVLATGLQDTLPPFPGADRFYGASVHHCLYCDGYEYRSRPLAAFGEGKKGADLAVMMLQWSQDVVLCTNATPLADDDCLRLASRGIRVRQEPIQSLEGQGAVLERIEFASGGPEERAALFFATDSKQRSRLHRALGCQTDQNGGVVVDEDGETSVPGVFAAGDASRDVLQIAVAMGEGVRAGVAVNKSLLREDGLCR